MNLDWFGQTRGYTIMLAFFGMYPIVTSLLWVIGGLFFFFRRDFGRGDGESSDFNWPPVSILIPAFCEEASIRATLEGVVNLDYPDFEVIVINDGSTDATAERVKPFLADPRVRLLDKAVNEGKAMALNDAIRCTRADLILVMDADSVPDPMVLRHMVPHFRSPRVAAVAGNPRVRNRGSLLARLQAVEFTSVVGLLRRAQRIWGRVMCISGVIGMYRKSAMLDVGLYTPGMATEDIDLTWKLQKKFYEVRYEPRALTWMIVPETLSVLWRQRRRWSTGLGQVLRRHAGVLKSWKMRRLHPIYIEAVLSVCWAVVFVIVSSYAALCYALGHVPPGEFIMPRLWGMILFSACLLQLACGLAVDSKYERVMLRDSFLTILYPTGYWMLLAMSTALYTPRAIFRKLNLARPTRWHIPHALVLAILLAVGMGRAAEQASSLADRARDLAREGHSAESLELYRQALKIDPDDPDIRRDYAVVLGWAEHYSESVREFRLLAAKDPDQPVWALREMARSELFAGNTAAGLRILDELIANGDDSEETAQRKGLALRWTGRCAEAEHWYRGLLQSDPHSRPARLGLIYSLADQNRLTAALNAAREALIADPQAWEFLKAKGQVLNWMGRHLEARRAFEAIPAEHSNDREVMEGRAVAARWGSDSAAAMRDASALAAAFPDNPAIASLRRDVLLENGFGLNTGFRLIDDSDGLADLTWSEDFSLHATAAHAFQFEAQNRRFSQPDVLGWRRYEAGWSGALSRVVALHASAADLRYPGGNHRLFGEGSVSLSLSDTVHISAGGGSLALDAFQAVRDRITGRDVFASVLLRPTWRLNWETTAAEYHFSDQVRRRRFNSAAFYRLTTHRRARLDVGEQSTLMWHNRGSNDYYSPSFFQTHLAVGRLSGYLSRTLEYRVETGAGAQTEPGVARESPLVASASLNWRISPALLLSVEGGRSTSSLDRVIPGRTPYSRRFAAINLVYRFNR